jgi:hypothetical protein
MPAGAPIESRNYVRQDADLHRVHALPAKPFAELPID